jgi:TolB-like protein
MGIHEEKAHAVVSDLIGEFKDHIGEFRGEILNVAGDGVLAFFDSVLAAVKFAVSIQDIINRRGLTGPDGKQIRVRIGINLGDVILDGGTVYGDSVNIASRLESIATPGSVCVSAAVYDQIRNKLAYGYECLGLQKLKNIADPVEVYRLHPDGGAVMTASPLRGTNDRDSDSIDALPARPSVAVLPFANMSGDAGEDFFADGITEDIITNLSKFKDLFVIARGSSFVYKHTALPPADQIGRALGVRYLLNGSVRRAGGRVRISVRLMDAESDRTLWADRIDRRYDDIFELQDEITEIIVSALAVQVETAERDRMRQQPLADMEAYGLVLQGQQKLFRYTRNDNAEARELYTAALKADSRYARAQAALSRTYNFEWRYSWTESPEDALNRALELARNAVAIDDRDARGHAELGFVNLYRKQHRASIDAYQRSLKLNPNDADVMAEMADALAHAGRSEEAITYFEKAMRLNPFYPDQYLLDLGAAYFNLKQYEEAIETLERMHNPAEGRRVLAASHAHLGRLGEARRQATLVLEAHPDFSLQQWESIQPDKYPDDTAHFVEGLKKAGL